MKYLGHKNIKIIVQAFCDIDIFNGENLFKHCIPGNDIGIVIQR